MAVTKTSLCSREQWHLWSNCNSSLVTFDQWRGYYNQQQKMWLTSQNFLLGSHSVLSMSHLGKQHLPCVTIPWKMFFLYSPVCPAGALWQGAVLNGPTTLFLVDAGRKLQLLIMYESGDCLHACVLLPRHAVTGMLMTFSTSVWLNRPVA